ncbi:MAG: sigma-70 family RNA polymerase sigma factor [Oscillospiraceae bacterium]|nr:sigma-70 family RNA polymerase sigma factor [Oscillospiraceae bacterium]
MQENEIRHLLQSAPERGCQALFEEYWQYAYAIVFHILRDCGSREDMEECTADALNDVMRGFEPAHSGSLKAYIGTIAKRRAIERRRVQLPKHGRTVSLDSEDGMALPSEEDVAASAEQTELTKRLLNAITALGEPDATILIHKYFYDRNSVQIARSLGMNPITVRSRCARALKRLRSSLSDLNGKE